MAVYRVELTATVVGYAEIGGDPPAIPPAEVAALRRRAAEAGLLPALLAGAPVRTAVSIGIQAVPDGDLCRAVGLLTPDGES